MTDISPEQSEPTPEALDSAETSEGVEPDEDHADDPRLAKARNEAKNLRSRLRDAEAERDGLRTSLNAYNHADATVIAAETLTDGEDLFRGGVELADLLGDDGTVDDDLVKEAARRVASEHPNWTPDRVVRGLTPGGSSSSGSGSTWQKVLQGK